MLYSERNREPVYPLRADIPSETRRKLFYTLQSLTQKQAEPNAFESLLIEVEQQLLQRYGQLTRSAYKAARVSDDPVVEHFFRCSDEQLLDFVEVCFKSFHYSPREGGIEPINNIFRLDGIAYELSPWVEHEIPGEAFIGGRRSSGRRIETIYPQFVRVTDQFVQQVSIEKTLKVLAIPTFREANKEFLRAHLSFRKGEYESAITQACAAYESTLKAICAERNWAFDQNRDTTAKLIEICQGQNLFPPFYAELLKSVGTIRNRLGDAHGRGPAKAHDASVLQAEHMLNVTASNMLFLARSAGLA